MVYVGYKATRRHERSGVGAGRNRCSLAVVYNLLASWALWQLLGLFKSVIYWLSAPFIRGN